MAHTLKLNIFIIELRRKREKNLLEWKEFYKNTFENTESGEISKEQFYSKFKENLISYFSDFFTENEKRTKGISLKSIDVIKEKNIFSGTFKGGLTGIEQEIYETNNANDTKGTLGFDDIATLIYYFKLWTPYDSNFGILMLQSYSSLGCNAEITDVLKKFFNNKGYTLKLSKFVPHEMVEHFKETSSIYQISFERKNLSTSTRHHLSPIYDDFPNVNAKLIFSGFRVSPERIWDKLKNNGIKLLEADITSLEMSENDQYVTIVSYEDAEGHKSNLNISKEDSDLKPNIFLPDSIKEEGKESPDLAKIENHTNFILEKIKREIGYTVDDTI
jgi:hypothetical protein